jgi:general L-amino acid transport system permease protein
MSGQPTSLATAQGGVLASAAARRWLVQLVIVAVLVAIGYVALGNLKGNLAQRGLSLGFDFLRQEAGFEISFSLIPFSAGDNYMRVFLVGLTNTLLVTILAIIFSTVLGFIVGIARLSSTWALQKAAVSMSRSCAICPSSCTSCCGTMLPCATCPCPSRRSGCSTWPS